VTFLKSLFKKKPWRTSWIYCECGHDLNGDDKSFVYDRYDQDGRNDVKYICANCGKESHFDLDAPVALSREEA
jgi:hypothetical protein